jgi:phosphatidylserine/phosphatidylglycerophosphate/cardiolipin synthase-like enzyme
VKLIVQPESGFGPLLGAIRAARRTIDVTIFRLDRKDIATALADAVQRGVVVRALVAHTNRGGDAQLRRLEQQLLALGLLVSRTADDLVRYHGKFMVIDGTLHLLGFNFTKSDGARRSFAIQSRDKRALRDALALFECDVRKQPYTGTLASPLVVSPETSRAALRQFVAKARRRLAVYDPRLDDPEFVRLLKERAAAGVLVQVIGKARGLGQADVPVRMLKDPKLHVRAMIRDGTRAFVGSQSLRALELDQRREVGLIITNPSIARQMLEVFDQDWIASGPGKEDKETLAEQEPSRDAPPPPRAVAPATAREVGAQT